MRENIKCTSVNCPMRDTCYRNRNEPKDNQSCYNFEYTCNKFSGFDDYISCK